MTFWVRIYLILFVITTYEYKHNTHNMNNKCMLLAVVLEFLFDKWTRKQTNKQTNKQTTEFCIMCRLCTAVMCKHVCTCEQEPVLTIGLYMYIYKYVLCTWWSELRLSTSCRLASVKEDWDGILLCMSHTYAVHCFPTDHCCTSTPGNHTLHTYQVIPYIQQTTDSFMNCDLLEWYYSEYTSSQAIGLYRPYIVIDLTALM